MPEPALDDLAAAVLDGDDIDWTSAEQQITTAEGHALAAELRTLSTFTRRRTAARRSTSASPTLPFTFEIVRWLAIAASAVGVAGMTVGLAGPSPGRMLVRFAILLAFGGAAAFLDLGARDRRTRMLAGAYWTIAAAFSAPGVTALAAQPWADAWLPLVFAVRPEAFLPAFMWQFAREFPFISRFSAGDLWSARAARATFVVTICLFIANLAPLAHAALTPWVRPFLRMSPGSGALFWIIVFLGVIPAIAMIAWRGRTSADDENVRIRLFLYGIAAALGPVAVEVVAEGLFPRYGAFIRTPAGQFWGGWIIYPPLLALPALTAYAVAAGDVLYVRVAVQHALRHLLAKWLILGSACSASGVLLVYVYGHRDQQVSKVLEAPQARALVAIVGVAVALLACRRYLLHAVDRWSVSGQENPSAMLTIMAERMKNGRTPVEIASTLVAAAERTLQTSAEVLLPEGDRLWPARADTPPPPSKSLIPILVAGAYGPCFVDDRHRNSYYPLLTEEDRVWIDEQRIALMVPVLPGRGAGGLSAVVCLRHRSNAIGFSSDELRFLTAVAASAALAYDGLRPARQETDAREDSGNELALQCERCGLVEVRSHQQDGCACGGRWQSAALPKDLLRRFSIDRFIGAGGMGTVYRGTDLRLGRHVAVKTLPRLSTSAADRLIVEARTMAGLSHPHIAVLYGTELWRGTPVLILEYLTDGTLAAQLRRGGLPLERALRLGIELAGALEHVHASGLYHGDIKPSNIGFTGEGTVKYLDFGLSQALWQSLEPPLTFDGQADRPIAGTPAYLSPEVLNGAVAGPALDLWALTLVVYECAAGRHPFMNGATTRSRILDGLSESRVDRSLQPPLRQWFATALGSDPTRRPPTARTLVTELTNLLAIARDQTPPGRSRI